MSKLTPLQLNNPIVQQKVKEIFEQVLDRDNKAGAYNLLQSIQETVEKQSGQISPQLHSFYQTVIRRLRMFFWPILPADEQINFLKKNLAEIVANSEWYLNHHFPWDNQLLTGMFMYSLFPRNEFRKKIKQTFDNNQGKIGPLTIREWLNDYNQFQDFTQRTNISHLEYIAQSSKANRLNEKEKEALRQLLKFYDNYLLITPLSTAPIEVAIREYQSGNPAKPTNPIKPANSINQNKSDNNPKVVNLRK